MNWILHDFVETSGLSDDFTIQIPVEDVATIIVCKASFTASFRQAWLRVAVRPFESCILVRLCKVWCACIILYDVGLVRSVSKLLKPLEVNATDAGPTVVISVDAIECQAFSHHGTAETCGSVQSLVKRNKLSKARLGPGLLSTEFVSRTLCAEETGCSIVLPTADDAFWIFLDRFRFLSYSMLSLSGLSSHLDSQCPHQKLSVVVLAAGHNSIGLGLRASEVRITKATSEGLVP